MRRRAKVSFHDEIAKGLQEAVDYEEGRLKDVRTHKYTRCVEPLRDFTPADIKQIRKNAVMTQDLFARCIGVSKKSVEAWEYGRAKPDGAARRLLGLMCDNPHFAEENGIVYKEG